jgi:hypothetical protein
MGRSEPSWNATPTTTSATPATSAGDGTCVSTISPISVAVAGRSDTSSAYVARDRRAIASWSHTYGMTDEQTPTPMPAASATGSANAGAAAQPASGVTATRAISIAAPRPSTLSTRCATRCASTM